jgi:hypothetical protein
MRPATATAERTYSLLQPERLRVGTDFTSSCRPRCNDHRKLADIAEAAMGEALEQ